MNKFFKAAIVVVTLASFGSVAYAAYLTKDFRETPADCKDGWCNVEQTVVADDGSLQQTTLKVWVGK